MEKGREAQRRANASSGMVGEQLESHLHGGSSARLGLGREVEFGQFKLGERTEEADSSPPSTLHSLLLGKLPPLEFRPFQ